MDFMEQLLGSWLAPAGVVAFLTVLVGGITWGLQHNTWFAELFRRTGQLEKVQERQGELMDSIATKNLRMGIILDQIQKEVDQAVQDHQKHIDESDNWRQRLVIVETEVKELQKRG